MISEIEISYQNLELIRKELEANKPYEACGILIGIANETTTRIDEVMPVRRAKRSRLGFILDVRDFDIARDYAKKIGKEIVGIYHTHPIAPAIPSFGDKQNIKNFPLVWLIAGTDGIKAYIRDNGVKHLKIRKLK